MNWAAIFQESTAMSKKWAKCRSRDCCDGPPRSKRFRICETWSAIAIALKRPTFSVYARAAAIVALASAIAALGRETQAGEVAVTCTNPFSGASWRIAIDYDRRTVDSNPARISDTEISWRDATDGWNYILDRKSGKLTVILASATGGNFLYDRCGPAN
jgi:hypothetical protein